MPSEEKTLLDIYTLIMKEEDTINWKDNFPGLELLAKESCLVDSGYSIVKINVLPIEGYDDCTPQDLLDLTGGLMIHQEFTNGFIADEFGVETLGESYCWEGAAYLLMGEMLTEEEKLNILVNFVFKKDNGKYTIDDLAYSISSKEDKRKWYLLKGQEKNLFGENIGILGTVDEEHTVQETWKTNWEHYTKELGFYIIIINEDDTDEEELIDMEYKYQNEIPYPEDLDDEEEWDRYYRQLEKKYYGDDYYFNDKDDDYMFDVDDETEDYLDKWYKKKGYL